MKPLSPEQFRQWLDEKREIQILDVREQWEYETVRFDPSVWVPLGVLPSTSPPLDKSKPVVVCCHHGSRSLMGCMILMRLGYQNVYNLTGGIDYYAERIDPKMTRY